MLTIPTLTAIEQEFYDRLVEKTNIGRLIWKMKDSETFYIEFSDNWRLSKLRKFRVCVQRNTHSIANLVQVDGGYPVVNVYVRVNGDYLTSFMAPDNALVTTVQNHCEDRVRQLERVIQALDQL
jgi:hypothetical protein